jgi:glycosyltransferase involved in cell wall biosynthesis
MKVLFPIEYYPPFTMGGAEISTKLLAEELTKEGVEVHIFTPNYESFKNVESGKGGLHIHRFRSIRKFVLHGREAFQLSYRRRRALFYWLLSKYIRFSASEFSREISALCKKEDFDLVHAQNMESVLGLGMAKVNCPKIAHIRDLALFCVKREKLVGNVVCKKCSQTSIKACLVTNRFLANSIAQEIRWRKELIKNFDHYVAISEFIGNELKKEGIPQEKISIIPNPVSDNQISKLSKFEARKRLNLNRNNKIVLFVGSLTEEKGAHFLPILASKLRDKDFVVVGDGPLRHLFEKNTLSNIYYRGQVPQTEVKHYYRAADILIVPSLCQEAFGRAVVEGQINSVPAIVFKTGGLTELVEDGKTGILVKQGAVREMANAIVRIFSNEKTIKKMGIVGQKSAIKRFNVKAIVQQMLKLYERVLF